jgi:hypothetical protein
MFGEHRLPHQERRTVSRRGSVTAPAMAIGFHGVGVITFTTRYRMVPHGWLTPAALGAALGGRMRMVANVRLRFARAIRFTATAGLRQPLLVHEAGPLKNNDIRGAQTHVLQERRALARRGVQNRPRPVRIERCSATSETTRKTVAVSPPWYGNGPRLQGTANNVRRTPTAASRAAGVSPPWFGSRTGNGDRLSWSDFVHHSRSCGTPRLAHASCSRRRSWWTHANRRKCAASLCTGESFHSHGWITPAAPGARSRSAEK